MAQPLHAEKTFPVSKDRLYKAWTDPEELKHWWRPANNRLVNVEADMREGGVIKYDFENDNGHAFTISGQYEAVEPGKRLVYTWNWQIPEATVGNGEHRLTVEFEGEGESSTLKVTQEQLNGEEAVHPHHGGWEEGLEALKTHLTDATAVS